VRRCLALVTVLMWPMAAAAQPSVHEGRGFSWGGLVVVPVPLGELRYVEDPVAVPYYAPGAGVLGRLGWELPEGLGLYATFAVEAFAVEAQPALQRYRGGLELRWTIDTGSAALPFLSAGGAVEFFSRDGALGTTGGAAASAGVAFAVAPWAQVELGLELSVAFPGAAFVDTLWLLAPALGGTFFF
jgi:hypothetical protein